MLCAVFHLSLTYVQSSPSGEEGIIVTITQMRTMGIGTCRGPSEGDTVNKWRC